MLQSPTQRLVDIGFVDLLQLVASFGLELLSYVALDIRLIIDLGVVEEVITNNDASVITSRCCGCD